MTRTEAILRAVHAQLLRHHVDEATDLKAIVCEVHCRPGGGHPRSVTVHLRYETELVDARASVDAGGPREARRAI